MLSEINELGLRLKVLRKTHFMLRVMECHCPCKKGRVYTNLGGVHLVVQTRHLFVEGSLCRIGILKKLLFFLLHSLDAFQLD